METTIDFLGYPLAASPFSIILNRDSKISINTINQYSYCIGEQNLLFKEVLKGSDVLLPDGVGIVKACSFLTGKTISKVTGWDIHKHLLNILNKEGGKCFYLGSSGKTLSKIKDRINKEYPAIESAYYSPPYKERFSEEDMDEMVFNINSFRPDVVFIGLTAPKQEILSHLLKDKLETNVICSIGAAFDFYAGTIPRPGQLWIDLNLEWLGRFFREPKRMWKRYFYFGFVFVYYMFLKKAALYMPHFGDQITYSPRSLAPEVEKVEI
ncbi:WecB/TagA/CpsF family glycosyltransferase [Dyadobacter sp. CY107]|uniref:WecB/TagA/CpsF family glycosyltransferase n=1 Tax=Dyadobacter fanqingshengii TaxID=2906443 RepID=UPI001F1BF962|nr:WecB/TagA/CpsF family glycosyltransferase [Dyadobacter fanqingshengii]MCF2502823.1 WecB/TagA/CpsF family glycosyltransferase [Dyadobacter fanqingshengii]